MMSPRTPHWRVPAVGDRPTHGLARLAAEMVAAGPADLPSHLRRALELLDSVPDDEAALTALVADEPALTGDDGLDGFVVLLAQALCARAGQHPPAWVAERASRRAVAEPPSPLGASFSRRFAELVARASLTVQDRIEGRVARRMETGTRPAVIEMAASVADRLVLVQQTSRRRVASARRRARAFGRALVVLASQRPVRGLLRVASVTMLAAVVAVGVLGLGRPSAPSLGTDIGSDIGTDSSAAGVPGAGEPAPAAPTPAAPAPAEAVPPAPEPPPAALPESVVRLAMPISLRIPAISVDAPVVIVGLEPDGAMEIPADVRTVGWYDPVAGAGVVPGEPGTAVIAGHVDSRTQGRGAFWPLRDLAPGDLVEVVHADGVVSIWRIETVVRLPKTDVPIEEIFTFEGPERLALITCGGEFDRSSGAYLDNYVVTALPAPSSALAPRPFGPLES